MRKVIPVVISLMVVFSLTFNAIAQMKVRIKDIAKIQNLQEIQLFGYGLVVGLNGTGDKRGAPFTVQSISNMLQKLGITVNPKDMRLKNVAAVMVTSTFLPFTKVGNCIDVTVSSIGDATSLEGGTLLLTPLQGPDGVVYALAQGPVSIGGFNIAAGGTGARKNHPTVGRIPGGGIVEKEFPSSMPAGKSDISLILSQPDFTTATRISETINKAFSSEISTCLDANTIKVEVPEKYEEKNLIVDFISKVEELSVVPDTVAKVIINERTGTIVVGKNVRVSPVAVAHGNLFVTVKTMPVISQPTPFSSGETVVTKKTEVEVKEQKGRMSLLKGTTVEELVSTLNALGVTPRDMIAIFQALKEAGALQGELIIM
ncbi:flagellar basal body P-ring protein FlgI [Candidatus Aerophobetes bacterium]|nr:flagellar basal body P-ring protein FlgI [Candidatus Aerophobetes bacterium]